MASLESVSFPTEKYLCSFITRGYNEKEFPSHLIFAEPIGGEISIASEPEMFGNSPKTTKEKALDEQLCSSKFSRSSDKQHKVHCYYTSVPRIIKHKGMCANDLTSLNLDKVCLISRFYLITRMDTYQIFLLVLIYYITLCVDPIVRRDIDKRVWRC